MQKISISSRLTGQVFGNLTVRREFNAAQRRALDLLTRPAVSKREESAPESVPATPRRFFKIREVAR